MRALPRSSECTPMKRDVSSSAKQKARRTAGARPRLVMERLGKLEDMDRSFDIEFWQTLGDGAIFQAAWEMVEFYYRMKGRDLNELRLQRSVEHFQRQRS